ncbi:MAG: SBBP repeat-containing protein, partial [Acidimicrobiales bacterium]
PAAPDDRAAGYGRLPLRFEPNLGQVDDEVSFLARGPGYTAFLTPTGAVLALAGAGEPARMRLEGATPRSPGRGVGRQETTVNRLSGGDPSAWRTGVPTFGSVRFDGAYPGVDVVYRGGAGQLAYDFLVAPGADPDLITVGFDRAPTIDRRGRLVMAPAAGDIRHDPPVAFQEIDGRRRPVPARFEARGSTGIGFDLGPFDRSLPLVIDPTISYSTYLGGVLADTAFAVAVDAAGNAYVAGSTASDEFPTAGAIQPVRDTTTATDAFVAKINPSGTGLVWSTFLGGGAADAASGIGLDGAGNIYVAGSTSSTNFPTANPLQAAKGAGTTADAFVAKLSPAGNTLVWSTYLGGGGAEAANGLAVDAAGNAYVAGSTVSTDFPTANPLQPAKAGAAATADAFVAKLNPAGNTLVWSTYLGGGDGDSANGVAVDGAGNAYVAGSATSTDFPTAGALQAARGPGLGSDAFVTKLAADGRALAWSTYLGGAGVDTALGIAVDGAGSAYLTGSTDSDDFPVARAFQAAKGTSVDTDAFVSKLNPNGTALVYSTYLGGNESEVGQAIAVDGTGQAHVTGLTNSSLFPTVD